MENLITKVVRIVKTHDGHTQPAQCDIVLFKEKHMLIHIGILLLISAS